MCMWMVYCQWYLVYVCICRSTSISLRKQSPVHGCVYPCISGLANFCQYPSPRIPSIYPTYVYISYIQYIIYVHMTYVIWKFHVPGPSPPWWEILHLSPALMQSMTFHESGKILPQVLYGFKLYGNFQDFSSFLKYPQSTAFHKRKTNIRYIPAYTVFRRRPVKPHPAVTQSDVPQISHDFGNTNHQHPIAMRKKHRHHKKLIKNVQHVSKMIYPPGEQYMPPLEKETHLQLRFGKGISPRNDLDHRFNDPNHSPTATWTCNCLGLLTARPAFSVLASRRAASAAKRRL